MARPRGVDRPRPRVRRRRPRPAARHVLRRRADARLARACPLLRPRPAAARRADEPPRRREPRVARARADVARRRGDPRRARPLVPRGRDDRGARARRPEAVLLRRAVARVAPREGGARVGGGDAARPHHGRHRAARPVRGAVPLQEVEGEAGAGEALADRPAREGATRRGAGARVDDEAPPDARLRVPQARPVGPDRARRGRSSSSRRATSCSSTARRSCSSGASTSRSSARTGRARRRCSRPCSVSGSRTRDGSRSATESSRPTSPSTRRSCPSTARSSTSRQRRRGCPRPQAQNLLGRFLFSGWETHEKQVSVLSGGERRRLALALVVASGANLLVLDEPTNHLDLESREALEAALEAFPGTVLLVSHDRAVLDAVPDRIVAVEDLALRSYDGGWADLVRVRDAAPAQASPSGSRRRSPRASRSPSLRRGGRRSSTASRSGSASWSRASRARGAACRELDGHGPARLVHRRARGARRPARAVGGPVRRGAGWSSRESSRSHRTRR